MPDRRLGERVVAAVRLAAGANASAEALQAHCRASLARYKVPDAIALVDSLPRNAMAKVIKRELRPLFEREWESLASREPGAGDTVARALQEAPACPTSPRSHLRCSDSCATCARTTTANGSSPTKRSTSAR